MPTGAEVKAYRDLTRIADAAERTAAAAERQADALEKVAAALAGFVEAGFLNGFDIYEGRDGSGWVASPRD